MAFTWGIDLSHFDLVIGTDGKLLTVYGAEEVRQRILVTLQHHWQEYFRNVPAGIPWYDYILGSKNKQIVEALLRRAILDVPDVFSILSLKLYPPTSTNRNYELDTLVEVLGDDSPEMIQLTESLII